MKNPLIVESQTPAYVATPTLPYESTIFESQVFVQSTFFNAQVFDTESDEPSQRVLPGDANPSVFTNDLREAERRATRVRHRDATVAATTAAASAVAHAAAAAAPTT